MCVDDLHILSPSPAMSTLIRERENERETERPKKRKRNVKGWKNEEKPSLHHNQPERIKAASKRIEEERDDEGGNEGMEVGECRSGPSQTSRMSKTEGKSAESCVSLLFRVNSKQGAAFRNIQSTNEVHALSLSFVVKATRLGDVQIWDRDPKNCRVEEREMKGARITVWICLLFISLIMFSV